MNIVVIPVYNRPHDLREALSSLCTQTKKNFRVLVVDDHSDVDLAPVISEFENRLLLSYVYMPENSGPGACRNEGIAFAHRNHCEGIIFLDSDDVLAPTAVAVLSKELGKNGAKVVATDIIHERRGDIFSTIKAPDSLIWLHGKIYNVDYLVSNHIKFPTNIRYNEDVDFNTRAFSYTEDISLQEVSLYCWRNNSDSVTRTTEYKFSEKYGEDAAVASVQPLLDIMNDVEKPPHQLTDRLVSIFNSYNALKYYNKLSDRLHEMLGKLFTDERFIKMFTPKKILDILQRVRKYLLIGGTMVPTIDFLKWLDQYGPDLAEKFKGGVNNGQNSSN